MIEGKKIRLRALTKSDFDKTFKWHNDLELKNLTLSHPFPVTDLQEEAWYESILNDKSNRNIYFGIEDKSNYQMVGIIFLSKINSVHSTCWLGVFIGEDASRGKGFGKEAVKLVVNYAFNNLNLRKISLEVVTTNKSAIEVYKKIGFKVEGELKKQVFIDGKYWNDFIMSTQKK
jgi:RimJ/RimL family protein N-acetyltransferase